MACRFFRGVDPHGAGTGLLRRTDTAYLVDGSLPALAIPASLHDPMARLDRLRPVKGVAQIAACIGREVECFGRFTLAGDRAARQARPTGDRELAFAAASH
jgi:hypothetical protein